MKNLLNLKGLCRSSQLALNPDGQPTVERRSNDGHVRRHLPVGLTKLLSLFLLLTLGVGQMWADSSVNGGDVYFDAGGSGWSVNNVQFVIGHDSYSNREYNMTAVTNTLLYYYSSPSWNDAKYFAFASGTTSWSDSNQPRWSSRCSYATKSTTEKSGYNLNSSNVYVFKSKGSNTCDDVESDSPYGWLGANYTSLNKTITIAAKVSTDGGETHSIASPPGTLTASSYSFTANGDNCKNPTSLSEGTITCGYTANTTLTAGSATGYTIEGWYDSDGDKLCNNGGTINPRSDATVYAYYKRNQYTVSYGVYNSENGSISLNSGSAVTSSSSSTLNHGTSISFTATPSSGYQVEGWYSDASCTAGNRLQEGGTSYNAGTLTAAKTVYVKFKVRTGGTITLSAGSNGQVSADNSTWGTTKTITDVTTATDVNIYARGNTGYQFSSWTKSSGLGTIKTNAASGVFTTVAYEDATVTASFTENKSTITVTTATSSQGTLKFENTSKSWGATASLGVATTQSITATAAAGFRFVRWDLTGAAATSSSTTSATIILKADGSGSTGTATAVFEEDLSTPWTIKGGIGLTGNNWTTAYNMTKKTGHSTESVAYYTFSVSAANIGDSQKDNYGFKLLQGETWYGAAADGDSYWVKGTTSNIGISTSNDKNIQIRANVAGNYEVKVDYSTPSSPKVTVTFPTTYTVNFGVSPAAAADAPTNDRSLSDGDLVFDGTSVTFTYSSANTGYTWSHWDVGGENVGTGSTYTTSITAATTVTAVYTEDTHTVTLVAGSNGSVHVTGGAATSGSAGIATSLGITAEANDGYVFSRWTVTSGEASDVTITNAESASTTVTATGDVTLTATFISAWAITGSSTTFGNWSTTAFGFSNFGTNASEKDTCYIEFDLPANTNFTFKIYNHLGKGDKWYGNNIERTYYMTYAVNNDQNWRFHESNSYKDCGLTTAGAGTYRFIWNITDEMLRVRFPESYTVTYGKVADNGQDIGGVTVTGDDGATLESGKYVAKGSATFTAADAANYTFIDWRTSNTYGEGTQLSTENPYTMTSIAENKTVYAHYAENMTTVNLSATNGKIQYWDGDSWEDAASSVNVGVATNCSIKAVPATGYYFAGWKKTACTDYSITGEEESEANNNTTLKGKGVGETTGQTLTANFVELNKVYFDNSDVAWENVYVYFGGYWNDENGACVNSAYPAVAMTNLGGGIYWAYVPREITKGDNVDNRHKIAFSSTEETIEGGNAYFTSTKAAQRDDYFYNGSLSMYRPYRAGDGDDKHSCEYYKSGYWVQYYATIGNGVEYYMKINTDDDDDYEIDTLFRATAEGTNYIRKATVRLDNGNKEMNFHISTGYGSTYTTSSNITASNCTDITVKPHGGSDFTFTTTSEGIYTFYLDQSGPQMKLTAVYPASVGDYRVLYTNSSVTIPRTSDVIKTTEEGSHTTTMYIDKDAAGAMLKLQKCTAITAGNPVWTDAGGTGAATLLTTYASNFASPGVYKFTVNVTDAGADNVATSATCSLSKIEAYTGPYYIKTDCAPGGWANYTQNAMEQNTINAAGAGYDYYFCRWIESTETNIKCVIATDYCDAVSDTLKTDDILRHGTGKEHETLPCAGSVRFSYDSKTNTLKRTYLQGANEGNSFCVLKPKEAGYVYTSEDGNTDMFSTLTKFKDNGNWTYQMDAWVYPGAKGGVYTDYPSTAPITRQELVDTVNNVLMGGEEKGSTRYHVRLVYDFKTDHLMSAWVAGAVDNDIDLSSDFMYIRKGQLQAEQISVASGKKITTAKKAYGVFQFSKDAMVGNMSTWNTMAYQLCKYYFSFPFDVNVSDIFGVGTFGTDWRIQKYNGAKRAEKGWFAGDGTTTFWEDVTIDSVLHAYEGYLLMLNRINFNDGSNGVWTNIGSGGSTYLYFPSKDDIGIVAKGTTTVKVPSHECKINRYFTQDLNTDGTPKAGARNHMITDSHWNMLGVPLFADTTGGDFTSTFKTVYDASQCGYLYTWDAATNSLSIADTKSFTFNAMYAYMVQYTGDITFNGSVISPSLAARRAEKKKEYTIDLNLTKDDLLAGHTYVELREEADNLFMLNEDMYMVKDSKTADVYTFAGCYDVSANVLSVENHVIPVGVNVKSAGTYTFSMPSNFDGTVTLIDNFTQTRTNLAIEDYEVSLPKGEINDRFLLEINIRQVPTAIDGVEGGSLKDGKAHKYIENGAMYILRDGKIYDARGNKVK